MTCIFNNTNNNFDVESNILTTTSKYKYVVQHIQTIYYISMITIIAYYKPCDLVSNIHLYNIIKIHIYGNTIYFMYC